MEFPSLPKFVTSGHRYGRLYDTPHSSIPAPPPSPHLKTLSQSLISKFKYVWKSSEEKFVTVCRVTGDVKTLEAILRRRRGRSRELGEDHLLIDGLHIVSYFGHGDTVKYFLEELRVPIDATTKVRDRR